MTTNSYSIGPDRSAIDMETVQRVLLLLAGICTILISVWLWLQSPAQQYEEMSQAYHTMFWLILASGLGASCLVVLLSAIRGDNYWKLALGFICVIYALYNALPLFRGWAMYGRGSADVLAHIGAAASILESGSFSANNLYPGVHILMSEFQFLGFEMRSINMLFSALFTLIYLFGMLILSRRLLDDRRAALVVLFVAAIPLYGKFQHTFHPVFFSFMLTPYYIYVFERYRRTDHVSYAILAVVLSAVLVVFHPTTSLYAIVMLIVAVAARVCYGRLSGNPVSATKGSSIVVFATVFWALWYSQFPWIRERLLIALGFASQDGSTVAESFGSQEVLRAPSLEYILVPLVNRYGPILLVCGLAALGAIVVARRLATNRGSAGETWLTGQYLTGVAISAVTITTFTSALAFHPIRNMRYMILMATLLCGLFVYWQVRSRGLSLSTDRRVKQVAAVFVVVLLIATVPIAATNSYLSLSHLTHSEADGTDWLYAHHDEDAQAVSHHVSTKMEGYSPAGRDTDLTFADIGDGSPIPQYLGYQHNETLQRTVQGNQTYLVTKEYDTEYRWSLKEFLQEDNVMYTQQEIRQLNGDPTVSRPYTNGNYSVWYVE